MIPQHVDHRLRQFLLLLTGFSLLATLVELVLEEHTGKVLQLVPFVLCGLGLTAVAAALLRPGSTSLRVLRVTMIVVGLGGIFGAGIHLWENFEFQQEMRPNVAFADLIVHTLKGAAPLLAPGVLVFAALVALVATYYHPVLVESRSP